LLNRNPRAYSDIKPLFVPSAKKSQRNRPTIRFSLYSGFDAKRNENTPISTTNMQTGLSSAQRKPPRVPWYRALKSVRTSVQMSPA